MGSTNGPNSEPETTNFHPHPDHPHTDTTMKSFLIAVLASVILVANSQPLEAKESEDSLWSDPLFVSAFYDALATRSAQQMYPSNKFVSKRNSELLNSLLGLPKNILRSGK